MSLPTKPYFIRALYEWCCDSGYTPHIAVFVNGHTRVPAQYVQDARIVLSISQTATKDLLIDNEWITFSARFGGVAHDIVIPIGHVEGIFAKESGEGMGFEVEEWLPESADAAAKEGTPPPPAGPAAGNQGGGGDAAKPKGPRLVK